MTRSTNVGCVDSPTVRLLDRIVSDSAIRNGKLMIRGTRLSIILVWASLAVGRTFGEVQQQSDIMADDARAALSHSTHLLR